MRKGQKMTPMSRRVAAKATLPYMLQVGWAAQAEVQALAEPVAAEAYSLIVLLCTLHKSIQTTHRKRYLTNVDLQGACQSVEGETDGFRETYHAFF